MVSTTNFMPLNRPGDKVGNRWDNGLTKPPIPSSQASSVVGCKKSHLHKIKPSQNSGINAGNDLQAQLLIEVLLALVSCWGKEKHFLEPAYHSRSQDSGLRATHLPHSHCPGFCHADRWNSRSHCRMEVPKPREVAREGQGTAGPSWPGWWQCQSILNKAGPWENCREKKNKPIREALLYRARIPLCSAPFTHTLNSTSQSSSVCQDTVQHAAKTS